MSPCTKLECQQLKCSVRSFVRSVQIGRLSKITTEQVDKRVLGAGMLERLGPSGSNKYLGIKTNFAFCFVVFAL